MNSWTAFDFELPGEPDQLKPFKTQSPQKNGNYFFDPTHCSLKTRQCDPSLFGRIGNCAAHYLLRTAHQQH